MFNKIYEWNEKTHQDFKETLRVMKENEIKTVKEGAYIIKVGQVGQIPMNIIIKLGKNFIDILIEEFEDVKETFELIDEITETKEERKERKLREDFLKQFAKREKERELYFKKAKIELNSEFFN